MKNEQKIIEVLDKLLGVVDNIHCDIDYNSYTVEDENTELLSQYADLLTELKLSVSDGDTKQST